MSTATTAIKPVLWRTIVRPPEASAAFYRDAFAKAGIQIGTYANQILDKVDFAEGPAEFDTTRIFGGQHLGLTVWTRRDKLYEKALSPEVGLIKVPAWVPIQVCRDEATRKELPNGKWVVSGMEPLLDADGHPGLFYVKRRDDGRLWLDSYRGYADYEWPPDYEWLFGLPRK